MKLKDVPQILKPASIVPHTHSVAELLGRIRLEYAANNRGARHNRLSDMIAVRHRVSKQRDDFNGKPSFGLGLRYITL